MVEVKREEIEMTTTGTVEPHLTVGGLARASGVAPSAVRFYEAQGLIASERTEGNQRRYCEPDACRIKVIRVAQRIGLSVAEIKKLLDELPSDPSLADWQRLTQHLVEEATQRMAQLRQVLNDITTGDKLCEISPARTI
jgi:MerR family redox-sensitive transcriptional activator SoxR